MHYFECYRNCSSRVVLLWILIVAGMQTATAEKTTDLQPSSFDENFRIHAGWQPLFNGKDLDGWYTFLQQHGHDQDPDRLITIHDGLIHLYRDTPEGSSVVMGYIATRKEYGDYHLRLEYRWGGKKFAPRMELPRDAGVYYHLTGDDAVWPRGLQYQVQEGDTGDLLALYGMQADTWSDPSTQDETQRTFQEPFDGGLPMVLEGSGIAYHKKRGMYEIDGWNRLEIVARGTTVTHVLNGKVVNRCENVRLVDPGDPSKATPVKRGRIALEIEAAEILYRNVEIKPLADELTERQPDAQPAAQVRVGAAAVNLRGDDTMPIAGSIEEHYASGQEGELRAVAVVVERPGDAKIAIVACDVLWVPRDIADTAVAEIQRTTGIPAAHVLINATHTHHAPSTAPAHAFGVSQAFRDEVQRGVVQAVRLADERLAAGSAGLYFRLAEESTIGANSRLLLEDGSITWINPRRESQSKARPTGPFDRELPLLDFRDSAGKSVALIFNHSTHTIGTRAGRDVRSPSFYGLAAQELEDETGATVCFLEGASGSTHNIEQVPVGVCIERLKTALRDARQRARPRTVDRLAGLRRPFRFKVRRFDDAEEDAKIARYTTRHVPDHAGRIREVFAQMRRQLRDQQGAERETWLQVLLIGDVAIVGVPAEYFTGLGVEIKRRSPFEFTYVAELANDWIGYLPDRQGHELGGYQTWMGLHSYAEPGTGERVVDEAVRMLDELGVVQE